MESSANPFAVLGEFFVPHRKPTPLVEIATNASLLTPKCETPGQGRLAMADYQQAVEQVDRLDLDDESVMELIISIYSGTEVEDSGGHNDLVTRRDAQADREGLQRAGWAEPAAEVRDEELPLTENGAAIHYYYHDVAKGSGEVEKLLNEDPKEFVRQAYEWWYREGTTAADGE